MSILHALRWSFLSELSTKAIGPLTFIILARLLVPEDFGVMTAALMVIGFSQIFWEAGMGKALVQRKTDIDDAANVAFWVNIGTGIITATLLFSMSEIIANFFFHDNKVSTVIKIMTLQIFLGAGSSVHIALLQKSMEFKKLFWVRFNTVTLSGVISIPLALNGAGYWALLVGTLAGQFAQMIVLWMVNPWRPKLTFNIHLAKDIGQFGGWVGMSGLLAWFYMWADTLIVGMYLGSHELGIYRTGNQIAAMIFAVFLGPIIPVLYSHLSKKSISKESIRIDATRIIKLLILCSIPAGMILFQLSPDIEKIILGERWNGISFVLGMFFLVHGFAWVVGMNGEFFRAIGKPKFETIAMLVSAPAFLAIYIGCINNGLHNFMIARFSAMSIGLIIQLYLAGKILNISISSIYLFMIKITIVSALCVLFSKSLILPTIKNCVISLFLNTSIYITVCVSVIYALERKKSLKSSIEFLKKNKINSKK